MKEERRVLHVIATNTLAGAEKYLLHVLPPLKEKGINSSLLLICPPSFLKTFPEYLETFRKKGIETETIVCKKTLSIKVLFQVKNFIQANKFYFVHSHLLRTDLLLALVKKFFFKNLFLINTLHGYRESVIINYEPGRKVAGGKIFNLLNRVVLKTFDKTISISQTMSQLYVDLGLTKKFFPVIPHGLDIDYTKLTDEGKKTKIPVIAVVGRLAPIKGQIFAIRALPQVLTNFPDCILQIVGTGASDQMLKDEVAHLQLQNSVQFTGFQNNPYQFIKNANVLVVPSLYEPFGLVYLEAMALQTPIVSFDIPIAKELLNHRFTALLCKIKDHKDMAVKIIDLLKSPVLCNNIADNALQEYRQNYTLEIMVDKTADFYNSLF